MARKFGGKFSPDGSSDGPDDRPHEDRPAYHGARVSPAGARSNVLFIPGVVLAILSINDGAIGMAAGLAGAAALLLGAWLLRDGLIAESAYHERKIARRPAIPRKIFAAVLCGIGAGIAAWRSEPGLIAPLIFGGAAGVLHIGAFGIDPLKDKGMEGIDTFTQDRVAKVVDEAMQMHGAGGISQDHDLASMWTHIRTLRFADGPDAVHRRQVARAELRKYANETLCRDLLQVSI